MQTWHTFTKHFREIIDSTSHKSILEEVVATPNNLLLYSVHGFPINLFLDEVLKSRLKIQTIYRNKALWNKTIPYIENQYFFEVDLMNPDIPKDYSFLTELILHIIKMRSIANMKHLFIIKHIELLREYFFEFRILLERYSANVVFLCTTHSISHIEAPIQSRFNLFRIPLFTTYEIETIFQNYLHKQTSPEFRRNIIKAIFFADVCIPCTPSCNTYNFPPLYEFIKSYEKTKNNLEEIRALAYKCCQYSIGIPELVADFIRLLDDSSIQLITFKSKKKYIQAKEDYRHKIINIGTELDHYLCQTNRGREPIYIEAFLCQIILL